METISNALQEYQEKVPNLTNHDFEMNCLPLETHECLLNKSLEIEKLRFPEFFNSSKGEADLRADFEVKSKSSLYKIDANTMIEKRNRKNSFETRVRKKVSSPILEKVNLNSSTAINIADK